MDTILLASNNAGKITEIKAMFAPLNITILSLQDAGIDIDVEETGTTFLDNARLKVHEIAKYTDLPILADDSGLCVDALDGAPGVYSARYAGDGHDDTANNLKLLDALSGIQARHAYFVAVLVLLLPNKQELIAEGRLDGYISETQRGTNGFGYNPVFYMPYFNKNLAEVSAEVKNEVSHRKRALENLLEQVKDLKE